MAFRLPLFLLALAIPAFACADCFVGGFCFAEPNLENPELGAWKYTLGVNWTTEGAYGNARLNLSFGWEDHACNCLEFDEAFAIPDTAGVAPGEDHGVPCTVYWGGDFLCEGIEDNPDLDEPILRFSPIEGICQPGEEGTGLFVFYCDWEPRPLDLPNTFLSYQTTGPVCFGVLSGVLPVLACGPVPVAPRSWSEIKSDY